MPRARARQAANEMGGAGRMFRRFGEHEAKEFGEGLGSGGNERLAFVLRQTN